MWQIFAFFSTVLANVDELATIQKLLFWEQTEEPDRELLLPKNPLPLLGLSAENTELAPRVRFAWEGYLSERLYEASQSFYNVCLKNKDRQCEYADDAAVRSVALMEKVCRFATFFVRMVDVRGFLPAGNTLVEKKARLDYENQLKEANRNPSLKVDFEYADQKIQRARGDLGSDTQGTKTLMDSLFQAESANYNVVGVNALTSLFLSKRAFASSIFTQMRLRLHISLWGLRLAVFDHPNVLLALGSSADKTVLKLKLMASRGVSAILRTLAYMQNCREMGQEMNEGERIRLRLNISLYEAAWYDFMSSIGLISPTQAAKYKYWADDEIERHYRWETAKTRAKTAAKVAVAATLTGVALTGVGALAAVPVAAGLGAASLGLKTAGLATLAATQAANSAVAISTSAAVVAGAPLAVAGAGYGIKNGVKYLTRGPIKKPEAVELYKRARSLNPSEYFLKASGEFLNLGRPDRLK